MRLSFVSAFLLSGGTLLWGCTGIIGGSEITPGGDGPSFTCEGAPFPILLHHGFSGGDGQSAANYFRDVADDLSWRGDIVYEASVAPFNSSEVRGAELSDIVEQVLFETGACKVNIIAHSQGGLDARYMISSLGYGDVVASLVTVATPHQGTALADLALGLVPGWSDGLANAIAGWVGGTSDDINDNPDLREALISLSEDYAPTFNAENPDDNRVAYYSIAGRTLGTRAEGSCAGSLFGNQPGRDWPDAMLAVSGVFLAGSIFWPEANDGVVSVASSRWGDFLGCYAADHQDLIGAYSGSWSDQSGDFDHIQMYRDLVDFLHSNDF